MHKIKRFFLGLGLAALVSLPIGDIFLTTGCGTTAQGTAYKTLYGVEASTDAAVKGYLDLVVQGAVATNSVPIVMHDYNLFQLTVRAAITAAQGNSNAVASPTVTAAAAAVVSDIYTAKGGK